MKLGAIRTTVDIPAPLYRRLKKQAAARGRSVEELILAGVKITLFVRNRRRTKRVRFPLIVSKGSKVHQTNEQIYKRVEFP
jgi:ribbon-helix-helix CopG family protein